MSKKFHVNPDGKVLPCDAAEGNCRYGADAPHFSSREEGEQYYASARKDDEMPLVKTKKITSPRLDPETRKKVNAARKEVAKANWGYTNIGNEDAMLVATYGSDKDLKNLAGVKLYSGEERLTPAMQKAWERTNDPDTKRQLVYNPSFRYPNMDVGLSGELLTSGEEIPDHIRHQIAATPEIPLRHKVTALQGIGKNTYYDMNKIVQDRRISHQARLLVASGPRFNGKIPNELADKLMEDPYAMEKYSTDNRVGQLVRHRIASDPEASPEKLSKIVDEIGRKQPSDMTVRESLSATLVQNPQMEVEDVLKLTSTSKAARNVDTYLTSTESHGPLDRIPTQSSGRKVSYYFDKNDIDKRGMDQESVDAYVRYIVKDHLYQTEYDPKTGVYSGFID